MELVTGHAGTEHISAADVASMLRGIYTDTDVVLSLDDNMSCTAVNANTIEIGAGGCLIQGHFCRVELAEQVTIESGAPGYKRNDIIIARYTLGTGNIQDIYLDVVKGIATTGEPSDPTLTTGSIDGGATLAEFALWRIPIDGVNVGTPERIMPLYDTVQDQITHVEETVTPKHLDITWAFGSGGTSTSNSKAHGLGRRPIIVAGQVTDYTGSASYVTVPSSQYSGTTNYWSFTLEATNTNITLFAVRCSGLAANGWWPSGTVRVYYL